MVPACRLSRGFAVSSVIIRGKAVGNNLLHRRQRISPLLILQKKLTPPELILGFAPISNRSALKYSTSAHTQNLQDEVTRQLFYAFAHPASGDKVEPYLDVNNLEELLIALGERPSEKRLRNLITYCDTDKNGTIELGEFLQGRRLVLSKEKHGGGSDRDGDMDVLVKSFHTLDKNQDGVLCVDELTGLLSTAGGYLTKEDAEEIIRLADISGDGVIDLDEFLRSMTDVTKSYLNWRLRSGFRAILIIGGPVCSGCDMYIYITIV